jgi:hypothetical protein
MPSSALIILTWFLLCALPIISILGLLHWYDLSIGKKTGDNAMGITFTLSGSHLENMTISAFDASDMVVTNLQRFTGNVTQKILYIHILSPEFRCIYTQSRIVCIVLFLLNKSPT